MSELKRPLKVFLCHSSADKQKVREVYRFLKKRGIQPWLDVEELLPGQDWALEIPKALEDSDAIIIFLSKGSISKEGYVQKEIKFALDRALEMPEGRIFIIPARLEPCDLPRSLSKYQWVNFYEVGGSERLVKALKLRGDQLQRTDVEPVSEEEAPLVLKHSEAEAETLVTRSGMSKSRKIDTAIVVALIGVVGTIVATLIGSPWLGNLLVPLPSATTTITNVAPTTATYSQTPESIQTSETPTLTITPTITLTLTTTPLPTEVTDDKGVSMVLVPAGEFIMGSENDNASRDEGPIHRVTLDAFYIDKYEVTNAFYKLCVDEGKCVKPRYGAGYVNPSMAEHPIVYVSWELANAYCEWRGARLPTEAEWEKAARGTDGRIYPWVGEVIDSTFARFAISGQSEEKTLIVGSKPKGKSPYGVYDMAGNVWEWVADRYLDTYYDTYPMDQWPRNPPGPTFGDRRVLRGGGWNDSLRDLRTTNRLAFEPDNQDIFNVGIRCAKAANPPQR